MCVGVRVSGIVFYFIVINKEIKKCFRGCKRFPILPHCKIVFTTLLFKESTFFVAVVRHETVVECYVVLSQGEEAAKKDDGEKETNVDRISLTSKIFEFEKN
jgi:hypothetical protein